MIGKCEPARPDRNEILTALDQMVDLAAPGQRFVIFLAGHGTQVPAPDALEEPDGLDEVFLPADFTFRGKSEFANQITDDEIGARIDRMVGAGAHVWLIADTCHSGSLRRSDGQNAVARFLDLGATGTGLPDPAPLIDTAVNSTDAGSFVGFYGAAVGSLAFETRPHEKAATHGLLTWALAQALRQKDARTYRALAAHVSAVLWQIGRGQADPVFSGALAGTQILADGQGRDTFEIAIGDQIEISGGLVDGLSAGAKVEVNTSEGKSLFRSTITSAGLTHARANLPKGETPGLDAALREEGLDPVRMRFRWLSDRAPSLSAQITSRPLDFGLRVDLPASDIPSDLSEPLRAAIGQVAPMVRVNADQPDYSIVVEEGRLHLRPAPPKAAVSLSAPANAEGAMAMAAILRRTAKSRALITVADALKKSPVSRSLEVSLAIMPGRETETGKCAHEGQKRRNIELPAARPPTVRHCDKVTLRVSNRGDAALDVTPLYLAADHQVFFLKDFPGYEKGGWRISPGERVDLSYTEATRTPDGTTLATGPMHLLLLAVRAKGEGDPVDFRYLQDISPPVRQRSGDVTPLAQLLDAAGFGLALKRSIGQHELGLGGALIVPIETIADDRLADQNR